MEDWEARDQGRLRALETALGGGWFYEGGRLWLREPTIEVAISREWDGEARWCVLVLASTAPFGRRMNAADWIVLATALLRELAALALAEVTHGSLVYPS